jgi:hypothetical protein
MALHVTFDTGALIALSSPSASKRNAMQAIANRVSERNGGFKREWIAIPANAVAEWWRTPRRGQIDRRASILGLGTVHLVDEKVAKAAGELLTRVARADGEQARVRLTVDATVMVIAAAHGPNLYTQDPDDMLRLKELGSFDVRVFDVSELAGS